MLIYGVTLLLVGTSLLAIPAALAVHLHRRHRLPYPLLTVGVLTFLPALMVQALLLGAVDRALLGILPVSALVVGVLVGFTSEIARLLGFQYLARGAVTRPQALLIGVGFALPATAYTGLLSLGVGISALLSPASGTDDPAALLADGVANALNALLPLAMHMALSWLVLLVFLRGELGWLFGAIFLHSVAEIMARLLGADTAWAVVGWRAGVALLSAALIVRLRPPD